MAHEERFLNSDVPLPDKAPFEALSQQGSSSYVGLETFPNPGCTTVSYESDEVMAKCPVTGQPDWYTCRIQLMKPEKLIESKSLKLFFHNIIVTAYTEDFGIFCEGLAVYIRDHIAETLEMDVDDVRVDLKQKSRGGITIHAVA